MRTLKIFIVLSALFVLSACGTKPEEEAPTSSVQSPLPEIEIQCGDTSCM